jgi:hypothetical protein
MRARLGFMPLLALPAMLRYLRNRRPNIPTASACSQARCHASADVAPTACRRFSPFAPLTMHQLPAHISPTDQPAACRRV